MLREDYEAPERYETKHSVIISPPDMTLQIVVIFLIIIGFMAIFSASAPKCMDAGENPAKFVFSQFIFCIFGFIGMKFLINFDYKRLVPWTIPILFGVLFLLLLVQFTPLGATVNEAQRWLTLGPIQFQPSEFAKIAVILSLASAFYKNTTVFVKQKIIVYFIPITIMLLLIFKQPNLSMVLLLSVISFIMYVCAGCAKKWILMIVGGIASVFVLLGGTLSLLKPYQLARITIWLNPESDPYGAGYNIIQSKVAIATGGLFGLGYGSSIQKLGYLPESHTDFIFAIIAEELGYVGCLLVIGLFWTFIHRGFLVASRCPDMYGKLLAVGITSAIGVQAVLNMCVACSFLPATGVTLPFISYGGSSLMVSMWMVGILLNISKKRVKKLRVHTNVRYL